MTHELDDMLREADALIARMTAKHGPLPRRPLWVALARLKAIAHRLCRPRLVKP
jgi:hypothetical protein